MAVTGMQSESAIEGRMIEERRLVGLLGVLYVVEIVRLVGVAAGPEAGQVAAEHGLEIVWGLTAAVVAIESAGL